MVSVRYGELGVGDIPYRTVDQTIDREEIKTTETTKRVSVVDIVFSIISFLFAIVFSDSLCYL